MAKYLVKNSGPLKGEVTISGAKNSVLPIMAATLLADEECLIYDAPDLRDVDVMCRIMEGLGVKVKADLANNVLSLNSEHITTNEAPRVHTYDGTAARASRQRKSSASGRMRYRRKTYRSASQGI